MKTKSLIVEAAVISGLLLTGCQTTNVTSSKEIAQFENISTLIPDIPDSDGDSVLDDIDACPMTPINIAVDKNGCPVPVDLIGYLTMELRVFFDSNSNELQNKYLPEVEKVAEKMNEYPNQVVVLSGHTSKRETMKTPVNVNVSADQLSENETRLGRLRAQSIKLALIERGIATYRIYTFDCASDMPIARSDTDEGAQMNQRVYGKAMPANDFLTDEGNRSTESYEYYKSSCQQF